LWTGIGWNRFGAKDFDQALAVANGIRYGLAASISSSDVNSIFQFTERIEWGILHINSPTVGGEAHVPFGDFYTDLKTVYVDYTGMRRESRIY